MGRADNGGGRAMWAVLRAEPLGGRRARETRDNRPLHGSP
jgi:hypothetical protein